MATHSSSLSRTNCIPMPAHGLTQFFSSLSIFLFLDGGSILSSMSSMSSMSPMCWHCNWFGANLAIVPILLYFLKTICWEDLPNTETETADACDHTLAMYRSIDTISLCFQKIHHIMVQVFPAALLTYHGSSCFQLLYHGSSCVRVAVSWLKLFATISS